MVLIWVGIFCGVWTTGIAKQRGRNVMEMFWVGMLFGPFGVVWAYFFMETRQEWEQSKDNKRAAKFAKRSGAR